MEDAITLWLGEGGGVHQRGYCLWLFLKYQSGAVDRRGEAGGGGGQGKGRAEIAEK